MQVLSTGLHLLSGHNLHYFAVQVSTVKVQQVHPAGLLLTLNGACTPTHVFAVRGEEAIL